jgi:hypothetical protein
MGFVGFPGQAGRYVSGLCVATLGLCAAGWLALAPVAFGYRSAGWPGPHGGPPGLTRTIGPEPRRSRTPRSGGLTSMESMPAGAELLMVGCGEEEAW